MMKEQTTDPKAKSQGSAAAPVDPQLEELKDLAVRHGRATLLAVVIFLVVAVPIFMYRYYRGAAREKSASLLSSATQPTDLENIIREYPDTPTTPIAMLTLARLLFDQQNYPKAQSTYEDFLARFGQHPMAPVARMGKAHCIEGKGLFQEALKEFEAFAAAHKGHFLSTQAVLAQARCLHHLGKTKEARIVLEDFMTANPKSPWKARAEEMLGDLDRPPVSAMPSAESLLPPGGTNAPLPSLMPALPGN